MVKSVTLRTSDIQGTANTNYDMLDNLGILIFQNIPGASFSGIGLSYDVERNVAQLTISSNRLSAASGAVTFSQTFTSGQSAGTTIENAWTTFRQSLTGTYTQFVWSSTNGSSITVTDSVKVQQIADALRTATTGTNVAVTIGANTWRIVQGCSTTTPAPAAAIEFTNDGACSCGGAGKYTIRPFIRNQNWGNTNGATCGAATQTITITFS